MKRKNVSEQKLNNRGFSLLELLVSVVILAVVAIPLMHGFITAANTNRKAKAVMEATTAGQNLMEQLKGQNVDPAVDPQYVVTDYSAPSGTATTGTAIRYESSYTISDTRVAANTLKVNGRDYHAKVTLEKKPYIHTGAGSAPALTEYNSREIPKVSTLNTKVSAILMGDSYQVENAVSQLLNYHDPDDHDTCKANLKRTIEVDIYPDQVLANVTYRDARDGDPVPESLQDHKVEVFEDGPRQIYSGSQLESVYVFFEPIYNGNDKETILIKNHKTDNKPVNVYLVSQEPATPVSNLTKEAYGVNVQFQDDTGAVSKCVTNLKQTSGDSTKYSYNGDSSSLALTSLGLEGMSSTGYWIKKQSKTCIYNIKVEVYDEKDKLLATLTGTTTK